MDKPDVLTQVSVGLKANIYFGGKVVSHTLWTQDGSRKTLGIILAGTYAFDTAAPERMEILAGDCRVRLSGQPEWKTVAPGRAFDVPGNSSFEIAVDEGPAEYLCSYF